MTAELEDARKLAHGTYDDVIVVEHRKPRGATLAGASAGLQAPPAQGEMLAPHVVLELPERSRVIDKAQQYEIDGVVSDRAPTVGASYRLIIGPATTQAGFNGMTAGGSLRYETMLR
jgi:hypothetical protein